MTDDIWRRHRTIWEKKPVLRAIYGEWYEEILSWLGPGPTVELGGGSGNLKEFAPQVISTDLVRLPWLNAVLDGQAMPFQPESVGNLVLIDVLHHIEQAGRFFDEAVRVLKPGGRIVILDPYVSWLSWPVYALVHPEPMDLRAAPLRVRAANPDRRPFDANQATATILFEQAAEEFDERYPTMRRIFQRKLAFFAYALSGGFEHPSLIPHFLVKPLLAVERKLRWMGRLLAFRILVVIEKRV